MGRSRAAVTTPAAEHAHALRWARPRRPLPPAGRGLVRALAPLRTPAPGRARGRGPAPAPVLAPEPRHLGPALVLAPGRSGAQPTAAGNTVARTGTPSRSDSSSTPRRPAQPGRTAPTSDDRSRATGPEARYEPRTGRFGRDGGNGGSRRRYDAGDDRQDRWPVRSPRPPASGAPSSRPPSRSERGDFGSSGGSRASGRPATQGGASRPRRPMTGDGLGPTGDRPDRSRRSDDVVGRQASGPGPRWGRSVDPSRRGPLQHDEKGELFERGTGRSGDRPSQGSYGRKPGTYQDGGVRRFSNASNAGFDRRTEGSGPGGRTSYRAGAPRKPVDGGASGAGDRRRSAASGRDLRPAGDGGYARRAYKRDERDGGAGNYEGPRRREVTGNASPRAPTGKCRLAGAVSPGAAPEHSVTTAHRRRKYEPAQRARDGRAASEYAANRRYSPRT